MATKPLLFTDTSDNTENVSHLWMSAVKFGERCANIKLPSHLETHLVMVLSSHTKKVELHRTVAETYLDARQKQDATSLILLAGRCLIVAGFFPLLARRFNVRESYYIQVGQSAYGAHATYWMGRGNKVYAHVSEEAAKNFIPLVATLRGMKNSPMAKEEIEAIGIPERSWN